MLVVLEPAADRHVDQAAASPLPPALSGHPAVLRHRRVLDQQRELRREPDRLLRLPRPHLRQARMRAGAVAAGLRARPDDGRKPAPRVAAVARRSHGIPYATDLAGPAAGGGLPAADHHPAELPQEARRSVRRSRDLIDVTSRCRRAIARGASWRYRSEQGPRGISAGQDCELDWDQPYASRRQPILARNVVATSQPLATQAGIAMLHAGGNAIDAALATAITLTVVEPCSNGLGSDLFALVWNDGELTGLNASGRAPAAWNPAYFAGQTAMPRAGWDTVTIPGAVSGWVALSQRFGKLPFADLFAPAIRYARDGYAVSPIVADKWAKVVPVLGHVPELRRAFPAARPGAASRRDFLVARHGRFAREDRGDRKARPSIAASSPRRWSRIRASSNGAHVARGFRVAYVRLGHADRARLSRLHGARDPAQRPGHRRVDGARHPRALRPRRGRRGLGRHAAPRNRGDEARLRRRVSLRQRSASMTVTSQQLLDAAVPREPCPAHRSASARRTFCHGTPPNAGTVYLTAADENGMMVSLIQSNYMGFGSGIVVPGTGISMQNRGTGFSLDPRHPNVVAGGKRPFHTIIPGFVTKDGAPFCTLGVMGGPIQPQGHVQTGVRLIDYDANPQAALDAPRWKVNGGRLCRPRDACIAALREGLAALGHRFASVPDSYMDFGAGQIIVRTEGGYVAGSDPRRDGQAAGF